MVDTVLIDARSSAVRRAIPPRRVRFLPGESRHLRGFRNQSWIMLWERGRKGQVARQIAPILAPAYVEECDRMLDELADSLAESRNPNFGAVGRYLLEQRSRLPFQHAHAARKVLVTP